MSKFSKIEICLDSAPRFVIGKAFSEELEMSLDDMNAACRYALNAFASFAFTVNAARQKMKLNKGKGANIMAKEKTMIGPAGESVPVAWVPAYDKLRDRKVRQVVKLYNDERARLDALMVRSLAVVQEIVEARGNGIAERGNFQVSSFDNLMRIEIVTRYKIELDDRALKAKQMMLAYINECLHEVSKSEERIAMLQMITDTFTPGKGGALRANMVVRLLTYKFRAKLWLDACEILRAAMTTNRVKSYINVSTRGTHQDEWEVIRLDIADCWPEGFVVE